MDIEVEEVKRLDGVAKSARIRVEVWFFSFLQPGGRLKYTKSKPESQARSRCLLGDRQGSGMFTEGCGNLEVQTKQEGGAIMLRDFLELLDTNDAVFWLRIATIGLMMAMLYLYGLCTDRVCAEQNAALPQWQ